MKLVSYPCIPILMLFLVYYIGELEQQKSHQLIPWAQKGLCIFSFWGDLKLPGFQAKKANKL